MRTAIPLGLCALTVIAGVVSASPVSPVFLGTQGTTLYRVTGSDIETFTLDDDITALSTAPDGTVWGTSLSDDDGDGLRELYTLENPLGDNPTLSLAGDFLEENTPSISFIGDVMYAFQKNPETPPDTGVLAIIDPDSQSQALVGDTGSTGIAPGGSAYDPVNDILYAMIKHGDGELLSVDYDLEAGTDPTATSLGALNLDFGNNGGEYFDGALYMLAQYVVDGPLALGVIDPDTAAYTELLVIGPPAKAPVGLAIVPEPTPLIILSVIGLAAFRRR